MTKKERKEWIRDLSKNVTATMLKVVETMPEEFDGAEIREYMVRAMADKAAWGKCKVTSSFPAGARRNAFNAWYAKHG